MIAEKYDYIITGAGAAGLSLVVHLLQSGKFKQKKILIVDKDAKQKNDRTWCFWEKEEGLFQSIVYKEWQQLMIYSDTLTKEVAINPYQYKLIRGIDFYKYCLAQIQNAPNVTFLQAPVTELFSDSKKTGIVVEEKKIYGKYIFNSILFKKPQLKEGDIYLLQHFKGWFVQTVSPVFNPALATLMDFRTDQKEGTTFFYVLPFSATEALVEYTLFSEKLLAQDEYEAALKHYLENVLQLKDYIIKQKEFGVIPMTNFSFEARQHNIINIGTAGGQTKGSSGYTFRFIQKHSAALVESLVQFGHPFAAKNLKKRFSFYDSVLLHILQNNTLPGAAIFSRLFEKNKPQMILKFLDNETTVAEEIGIIKTLPTLPFLKAAGAQIKYSF